MKLKYDTKRKEKKKRRKNHPTICTLNTLICVIICENGIIFGNAYGEMHDLLAWKRLASLIKFLRMNFISYCIICKIKDALIFGKIDTKSS